MSDHTTSARIARSREAVLTAARELLVAGGPSAVTVDAVVARSGVAKSTIYRHWDSRDELLIDVMYTIAPQLTPPPDDLPFRAALTWLVDLVEGLFEDPEWARVVPMLLMLKQHEDGLSHLHDRLRNEQMAVLDDVLRRGANEGILRDDYDVHEAAAQLFGPMFFLSLAGVRPTRPGFSDRTVDRFLALAADETKPVDSRRAPRPRPK